jgi:hypothetical protein
MSAKESGFFSNSEERPDGSTLSCHNLLDTGGHPDASLDRLNERTRDLTFAELETSQNLPGTLKLPS